MTGYDSMIPYFTPMQNTAHSYYPVDQQYNADGQLNTMAKDLSSKKYDQIYKQYYDFYTTNLNRLTSLYADTPPVSDLNKDYIRSKKNPKSFTYNNYFDGFKE